MAKKRQPNFPPFGKHIHRQMADVLANWPGTAEYDAALKGSITRPGGGARGEQMSDAADKWRIPAVALAKGIWDEFPNLSSTTVCQRIRKSLPKDNQPPSDRALKDHIRPLKPQK